MDGLMKWAKEEKNKKFVILFILLILLVIGLTFFPLNMKPSNQTSAVTLKQTSQNNETDYATVLEKKLINMLSKMEGVGQVNVMLTLNVTEEKVLAEDQSCHSQRTEEKDQAGGTRITESTQQTNDVVLQNGNTPYIIKEYAPEIGGVFILAEGAGDTLVKSQIIDAVSKLLDVPVHKISVEKKKN